MGTDRHQICCGFFSSPALDAHSFPLCCLTEQTNVISLGKLGRLFSCQPFPLSKSSPPCSLQKSAPNLQILSLPAARAETLPVPSPSPPTALIHQIPWPCSPPPAPDSSNPGTRCPLTKAAPSIKKQSPHHPCPDGAPGQKASSKRNNPASFCNQASFCCCTPWAPAHRRGDTVTKLKLQLSPPKGYNSPSWIRDLKQGSLIENKRDFI